MKKLLALLMTILALSFLSDCSEEEQTPAASSVVSTREPTLSEPTKPKNTALPAETEDARLPQKEENSTPEGENSTVMVD